MTSIEWTHLPGYSGKTWNPLLGCRRVSPGCGVTDAGGCYAERMARRLSGPGRPYEGLVRGGPKGPRWTGERRTASERMTIPIRRRVPTVWFVNSMGDLFFEGHSDEDIDQVFGVMWACLYAAGRAGDDGVPGHVFQCLTKRAGRMHDYMNQDRRRQHAEAAVTYGGGRDPDGIFDMVMGHRGPHPRIWLGVSAEDQQRADERIPWLLDTPAAVRFVSAEPLLGPIDFTRIRSGEDTIDALGGTLVTPTGVPEYPEQGYPVEPIDQIIVGGESGPGARPMDVGWVRSIKRQCREADAAFFFKQMGAQAIVTEDIREVVRIPAGHHIEGGVATLRFRDRKGGDPTEWPRDLRVREFPEVRDG